MAGAEDYTLTTKQVADALGVHPSTVWRIDPDRLKFARTPGGQRRYRQADVEAFRVGLLNPKGNDEQDDLTASD